MTEVLDEHELAYARFDADALHYRPLPPGDRFGERGTLQLLARAWEIAREDGADAHPAEGRRNQDVDRPLPHGNPRRRREDRPPDGTARRDRRARARTGDR